MNTPIDAELTPSNESVLLEAWSRRLCFPPWLWDGLSLIPTLITISDHLGSTGYPVNVCRTLPTFRTRRLPSVLLKPHDWFFFDWASPIYTSSVQQEGEATLRTAGQGVPGVQPGPPSSLPLTSCAALNTTQARHPSSLSEMG